VEDAIVTLLSRPPIDEKSTGAESSLIGERGIYSRQGKKGDSIGFSIVSRTSFATAPRPGGIVDEALAGASLPFYPT